MQKPENRPVIFQAEELRDIGGLYRGKSAVRNGKDDRKGIEHRDFVRALDDDHGQEHQGRRHNGDRFAAETVNGQTDADLAENADRADHGQNRGGGYFRNAHIRRMRHNVDKHGLQT